MQATALGLTGSGLWLRFLAPDVTDLGLWFTDRLEMLVSGFNGACGLVGTMTTATTTRRLRRGGGE